MYFYNDFHLQSILMGSIMNMKTTSCEMPWEFTWERGIRVLESERWLPVVPDL